MIRLGFPQPVGEVLASAIAGADGSWSTSLVIPERLPSGELISNGNMHLVAMNEQSQPLASAPFTFTRGAEPPAPPVDYSPGEGWRMALESDINADGVSDRVFYRPASIDHEGRSFGDERLDAVAVVADAVIIAQPATNGPWILLTVDQSGANADQPLFTYDGVTQRQPAAYLLALDPARGPTVNLLPIGASGASYGGPYGIDWSREAGGLRVISAP